MPNEINPFAAPQTESTGNPTDSSTGMWREGNLLVVSRFAEFPDRCVKCNEPAEGYLLKRNFSWHHPIIYLGLLLGVLPYLLVALLARKVAKHRVGLCPTHRSRRNYSILLACFSVFAGIGLFIFGLSDDLGALAVAGCVLFFVGIFIGIIGCSLLVPKRIEKDQTCWLKGAGSEFLAGLS